MYGTTKGAVDPPTSGQTVAVIPRTYDETETDTASNVRLQAPTVATLDGGSGLRHWSVVAVSDVTIEGVTISNYKPAGIVASGDSVGYENPR